MARAGKKRTSAFVQSPQRSLNGEGAFKPGPYGDHGEFCIALRPATGREIQYALASQSQISHVVEMSDEIDIKPQWRFVLEGGLRVLNIVSVVSVDDKGIDLKINCLEVILEEPIECG